ncbi:MAG: hypothetical protein OHK0046_50360 [Anaerolineae bacterium]
MEANNWKTQLLQSRSDPYDHTATTLLLLNGLDTADIAELPQAVLDLDSGWITTRSGRTYPLVSQAQQALHTLYAQDGEPAAGCLDEAVARLKPFEAEAHRRLAGAIWITDEDNLLTLETIGMQEAPILPLRFTFPFSIVERLQANETSVVALRARHVLQTAADWLMEETLPTRKPLIRRVLGLLRQGSLFFLLASTGVSGLNLIHNVLMGRLLSPSDYSQLTFVITLQLLIGLLPSAMQTVVARFSARYYAHEESPLLSALYRFTGRLGWRLGIATTLVILLLSPLIARFFQLDSIWLLLPIIITLPFFVRTGIDRGFLQGLGSYFWLSGAYLGEGVLRLGASVILGYALLAAGRSLDGAIWGLAQSMIVTWFISALALRHYSHTTLPDDADMLREQRKQWLQLGSLTGLVLIGQALITNSDFVLVKNFFSPEDAGLYAAVSVLGRIVYFGALPLTVLLVPLIARRQALNEPTRPILLLLIGGGAVVCTLLIVAAALFAPDILDLLYGTAYVPAASLLAPYALAASLYTLTNLVITYQIALGSGSETGLPILAGGAQIIGVLLFHESLAQVIVIQIGLMGILFGLVLWRTLRTGQSAATAASPAVAHG